MVNSRDAIEDMAKDEPKYDEPVYTEEEKKAINNEAKEANESWRDEKH